MYSRTPSHFTTVLSLSLHDALPFVPRRYDIIDLGAKAVIDEKSGAWYSFDSIRIRQGKKNSKKFLRDNPDTAKRIEDMILGKTNELAESLLVGVDAEEDEDDGES